MRNPSYAGIGIPLSGNANSDFIVLLIFIYFWRNKFA